MDRPDAWRLTERIEHELGKGDPFAAAVRAARMSMIITDPRQDDNPIVFANDAFLQLTGYRRDEVMGRNCRFLQGPDSDRGTIARVREAIAGAQDIIVDLLNYKKDGTPFWNVLHIGPVRSASGELQFFFASQFDVTERREALHVKTMLLHEIDHRVKNNLQLVSALIAMQARTIPDPSIRGTLGAMLQRIDALSTVHRRFYQSEDIARFDIAAFTRDIVSDLVGATGRSDIDLRFDLEPVQVPAAQAAPLALIVNELVTNALKHAFVGARSGRLAVTVRRSSADRCRIEVVDDGIGLRESATERPASFGRNLVRTLGRQLRADTVWTAAEPSGTRVSIDLPVEQSEPGEQP